jgi:hypothetical protein
MRRVNVPILATISLTTLLSIGCREKKNMESIFERGELLSSEIITGKAWHNKL